MAVTTCSLARGRLNLVSKAARSLRMSVAPGSDGVWASASMATVSPRPVMPRRSRGATP